MKSNRRNFLKLSGLAGIGLASTNILDGQEAVAATPAGITPFGRVVSISI